MFKSKEEKILIWLGQVVIELADWCFMVFSLSYIIYLGLENFKTGLISNYFDLNYLLVIILISGLISVFFKEDEGKRRLIRQKFVWAVIFAIILGTYSYSLLIDFIEIRLILALIVGLISFLALYLINESRND